MKLKSEEATTLMFVTMLVGPKGTSKLLNITSHGYNPEKFPFPVDSPPF